ncbi:MAG: PadR family transcriptional regulator [bacterium]|nr:PadR family transcriptional regulator [bacterium]MDE0290423.1 PadR family transcriptional regulator [bacterium]MDE0437813.1 PadR family transcriptional regulator [bacterium]
MSKTDRIEGHPTFEAHSRLFRDILLGFVRVHVLHCASRGPVYGVALNEELAVHGYNLSPGTLYPLLHGLEDIGFLERTPEVVGGKVRKYYSLTDRGHQALEDLRYKIRELVSDVLDGETVPAGSG